MMEFNQIHQIYVSLRNLLQAVVFSVAYYLLHPTVPMTISLHAVLDMPQNGFTL